MGASNWGHNLAHQKFFQNSNRSWNPLHSFAAAIFARRSGTPQWLCRRHLALRGEGPEWMASRKLGDDDCSAIKTYLHTKNQVAEIWVVTCEKGWLLIANCNFLQWFAGVLSIFSMVHRITTGSFKAKTTTIEPFFPCESRSSQENNNFPA